MYCTSRARASSIRLLLHQHQQKLCADKAIKYKHCTVSAIILHITNWSNSFICMKPFRVTWLLSCNITYCEIQNIKYQPCLSLLNITQRTAVLKQVQSHANHFSSVRGNANLCWKWAVIAMGHWITSLIKTVMVRYKKEMNMSTSGDKTGILYDIVQQCV